ncbi:MAG: alpha/beta fold hydrolase [Dehalococcoidia bacterium]
MPKQEIRFITTLDGVRIACGIAGRGSPLVKAPNWLSHVEFDWGSPIWRHWWEGLSQKHLFVRFDQRGCGLSDREVEDLSLDSWVSDLECVVDGLGLDRFALLGMSQGAAVAAEYAVRHPDRLSHLVLYGGFSRGWAKRGGSTAEYSALLTLIREGWGRENAAYRQVFTSQFIPEGTAEQMQWFNELERVSASAEGAVRFQEEVGKIDVLDRLELITTPTMVFHARHDARIPFEQGRLLASLIPHARFIPLESMNHILLENEPAWPVFLSELHTFLGGTDASMIRPPETLGNLTNREVEILRLIAVGRTDRQIAGELFLSVRTVGNHVKHILDKMNCANRTEAAVHATRMHLV